MTTEIIAILAPALGDELARDIIAHRKGLKCPLTPRGAKSLLGQYEKTGNPIAAAEEHLNRGWRGFNAEWMTRPQRFNDHHNPTPKTGANYGNPSNDVAPLPAISPERRAEIAELARAAAAKMRVKA